MSSGALVEIVEVALAPYDDELLVGRHIDLPKTAAVVEGHRFPIVGWAIGRREPVVAVELVSEGRVLTSVPVQESRPDLAAAFPDVSGAEQGGYRASGVVAGTAELGLELRAVLRDQSRVQLATLRARRRWSEQDVMPGTALVSVVIAARDGWGSLAGAIESVLAQTYPHFEVLVVGDAGSPSAAGEVARGYAGVRLVDSGEEGLAAARNAGLASTAGGFVVFLDAEDRLLPDALETGLVELALHPEYALVSGTAHVLGNDPAAAEYPQQPLITHDHYTALLRENYVLSHAAVMYRREALEEVGGFDAELPVLSEYELHLRIARRFPVGCHPRRVAEDRWYGRRAESAEAMLQTGEAILRRQRPHVRQDTVQRTALGVGTARWRSQWNALLADRRKETAGTGSLPDVVRVRRRRASAPRVGKLAFGDLRRVTPISTNFGYDRGRPVDRHYIEGFLSRHAEDIRGRVLEVQENDYTMRFGSDRVQRSDVLSLDPGNPRATIVGDLAQQASLPEGVYDCVVLTQTIHLVFDVAAALDTVHRGLRDGGVLLLTTPGISQVEWGETWHWGFTVLSAKRLLEERFGPGNVELESHGNVLAATAFLQGIAVEEVTADELDYCDPAYPVIVAARAVKAG